LAGLSVCALVVFLLLLFDGYLAERIQSVTTPGDARLGK